MKKEILISNYVKGIASPNEHRQIADLLQTDPEFKKALQLELMLHDIALKNLDNRIDSVLEKDIDDISEEELDNILEAQKDFYGLKPVKLWWQTKLFKFSLISTITIITVLIGLFWYQNKNRPVIGSPTNSSTIEKSTSQAPIDSVTNSNIKPIDQSSQSLTKQEDNIDMKIRNAINEIPTPAKVYGSAVSDKILSKALGFIEAKLYDSAYHYFDLYKKYAGSSENTRMYQAFCKLKTRKYQECIDILGVKNRNKEYLFYANIGLKNKEEARAIYQSIIGVEENKSKLGKMEMLLKSIE